MKITITAQGDKPDSLVDSRFGRATRFILYDTETASCEAISNAQGMDAAQGAGVKAAETISRYGAEVLITGHCGPTAFEALKAAGIKVVSGAEGCTVAQALEKFKSGELKPMASSDVVGHWQ